MFELSSLIKNINLVCNNIVCTFLTILKKNCLDSCHISFDVYFGIFEKFKIKDNFVFIHILNINVLFIKGKNLNSKI